MLKAAGIFLIFLAGTGIGFSKSMEFTRREQELRNFLQIAAYLKGAVRCGNASLPEAFLETAGKMEGTYRDFLMCVSASMKDAQGRLFGSIFRDCAEKILTETALSIEEKETVFSFGGRLGHLDREMQIRQIEVFEMELSEALENLKKELPEKKKLCRSMGILGGILLGVLLW